MKNDNLIVNERITHDIKKNPNNVVINLTRFELTQDEAQVLNLGLKHGALSRPKEIVATIEYVGKKLTTITFLKTTACLNKEYKQLYVLSHKTS